MSTGSGRPYLSVVVPAYNEERRLDVTLPRVLDYLDEKSLDGELLVVDDGSTDGTARKAEGLLRGRSGRVIRLADNRGKGAAVREGLTRAKGRWALLTDADLSTPIEEYASLAAAARDHEADLVIGSRGLADSRVEIRQSPPRRLAGRSFSLLTRTITRLPFRDTQCGFKLIDLERTRPIVAEMRVDRFAFDVELLFLCVRLGLRVREVPVTWRNVKPSHVGPIVDPVRMLADLARIRWRFRRGLYDPRMEPAGPRRGRD